MGETSGIALRALSVRKPLVVSNAGWFSELPDSVAAKVPVDEYEVETLAAVLERLAADRDARADGRRCAGRTFGASTTSEPRGSVRGCAGGSGGGRRGRDAVLDEVARAAHELGLRRRRPGARRRRARPREVGLGG